MARRDRERAERDLPRDVLPLLPVWPKRARQLRCPVNKWRF
jgi:hypothetical protein